MGRPGGQGRHAAGLIVEVAGRIAVVTGGASGIGRAMCLAFAGRGAEAVVVADVDAGGAAQVAAGIREHGHEAVAITTDMTSTDAIDSLVGEVQDAYGRIDLVCSNAGIIAGGGVEVPDETWERIWDVNVHSHVRLARAVLPGMLARGQGYLLFTASAAGLLTQLGSAPYAVTKHALVALAEWLSISYGGRGIGVSCLCPQAVSTNLGATSLRELGDLAPEAVREGSVPSALGSGSVSRQAAVDGVLTPDEVAASVLSGLAQESFLILPHPEVATYERRRADDRERWLGGMRRLQSRLAENG